MQRGTEEKKPEAKKEEPVKEVKKASIAGLSEADKAKKAKQDPKVKAFLKKVDAKKSSAADIYKLGQYGEATKIYKQAEEMIESALADFPLFKQELI